MMRSVCLFLLALALTASAFAMEAPKPAEALDGTDISWLGWLEPQMSTSGPQEIELTGFGGGGSCYTGCYTAQQSQGFCPAGQVAQATVSGPISACYLSSLRCVSSCSGPIVNPIGYTFCN